MMAVSANSFIFTDALAFGGPRPVYTLRYLERSIGALAQEHWELHRPFVQLRRHVEVRHRGFSFPMGIERKPAQVIKGLAV